MCLIQHRILIGLFDLSKNNMTSKKLKLKGKTLVKMPEVGKVRKFRRTLAAILILKVISITLGGNMTFAEYDRVQASTGLSGLRRTLQSSTVQYNYSTVQLCTIQYKKAQYSLMCTSRNHSNMNLNGARRNERIIQTRLDRWRQNDRLIWTRPSKLKNRDKKAENGNIGEKVIKEKVNNLKVVTWNLGSRLFRNKVDDLSHMVSDIIPDIAVITEANLQLSTDGYRVNIENYDIITTKDYNTLGVSRLVILVRNNLNYQLMNEKMEQEISTIWLKIPRRGKKPFILGAIYREHHLLNQQQPNLSGSPALQKSRWKRTIKQWMDVQAGADVLIVGDLNLDHLLWRDPDPAHSDMVNEIRDNIETRGYAQLVKGPTRYWKDTRPSCIDHAWSNNPAMVLHCKNVSRPVADHNLVEVLVRLKGSPRTNIEVVKRNLNKMDVKGFQTKIENYNWNEIYEIMDANLAYNFLEEKMCESLTEFVPIVKIQPGGRRKSWVSNQSKELIKTRDQLKNIACTTNLEDDWRKFRTCRNNVTNCIRKDKKLHFENLYSQADASRDTRALFRITKEKLGWTQGGPPSSLVSQGTQLNKPSEIAECLSKFFKEKITNLKNNIPDRNKDPLDILQAAMEAWSNAGNRTEFELRDVTLLEVTKILNELKNSSTMGHDGMDALTLKLVAKTVVKPILHILNQSIRTQTYCNKWKIGKLLPLLKSTDENKQNCKSYRPISLLPVTSKIMERAIQLQITEYMDKSRQWNKKPACLPAPAQHHHCSAAVDGLHNNSCR